ncbi:MAG TPA: prephenate dehydrogenase/arogenate dehydrogenase family protein [Gaiellaceae bacterium]|nr:prephenate dehydrogenase/arogenate dehydrogenase family protein [Gaiellaceae bacterium]
MERLSTHADIDPELARLRDRISAVDRELVAALNRRVELVRRVQELKREAGAPAIDAEREAAQFETLASENPGPLSTAALTSVFAAVLDVMKQETRPPAQPAPAPATTPRAEISRVAVVGTGLLGTSVALAARRAGAARAAAWDADAATLADAAGGGAVEAAGSLRDAVVDAELVVVAAPVGALPATVREVLEATPDATVTDVGSTKRTVAAVDDPRFVAGHPLAGGASGGPARAAADLFDGATWFLTPSAAADPARVETVERFVRALGAHPIRMDAEAHDRLIAVTSHLPHALANALMRAAAGAGEDALRHAAPSLREMTRVAGANALVWTDVFVDNGDLIAEAVAGHRRELEEVETALRAGDRAFLESWIADAESARRRMLEHAYRTEARLLHRIRVRVPDRPGVLARVTQLLGAAGINIEDFELRHVSPEYGGVLVVLVAGPDKADLARRLLRAEGYAAA